MQKRILLLFIFSIVTSLSVSAGKLEKGFEALRIYNYFKAREIFNSSLHKNPMAAGFGLATIYSRTDNPFYDVNLAHSAILVSTWGITKTSESEKAILVKFGATEKNIISLKIYIDTLAFHVAEKKASVAAWNEYLDFYCGSVLTKEAITIRNELAFGETQIAGTWEAYKNFAVLYPDAIQHQTAISMYQRLLYETETKSGNISSYEKFLVDHSENPDCTNAEDAIFSLSVPDHNMEEYHHFILKYPKNRNVTDAWKSVYALYTADGKSTTIAQFWIAYPDFPFKETISEDLRLSMTTFYPIRQNEKWGFMDSTGQIIIPCAFDWVESFSEGIASAGSNDRSGFIGKNGKIAIAFDFDEVEAFNKGLAQVKKNGKVGLTDRAGHLVVPIVYDAISDFYDARAVVVRDGKYGYIDMFGSEVIACQYEQAGDFSGGIAYVVDSSKYGFIDHSGKIIINCEFEWVENFDHGSARVKKDGKYGLLASDGKLLLPCEYTNISGFTEGFAMVVLSEQCGYIRRNGTFAISCKYELDKNLLGESTFKNGLVRIKNKGKCGMLDSTEKVIVPFEFDDVLPFENGLAPVRKKELWGFIDSKIRLVIPYQYDWVSSFSNGMARIKRDDKIGWIDTKGKEIIVPQFQNATYVNRFICVNDGNANGLMDKKGNWILPCNYSKIEFVDATILRVEMNEKFGYYNIVKCEFIWKEDGVE